MKRYFVFGIILVAVSLMSFIQNKAEIIYWSKDQKLHFSDFKGTPPKNAVGAGSSTILDYDFYDSVGIKRFYVYAAFEMSNSWTVDTSEGLLRHEQGHFDICEVHARRARSYLSKVKPQLLYTEAFLKVVDSFAEQCGKMQEKYDRDTYHGFDVDKQLKWEILIKQKLDSD